MFFVIKSSRSLIIATKFEKYFREPQYIKLLSKSLHIASTLVGESRNSSRPFKANAAKFCL